MNATNTPAWILDILIGLGEGTLVILIFLAAWVLLDKIEAAGRWIIDTAKWYARPRACVNCGSNPREVIRDAFTSEKLVPHFSASIKTRI